MTTDYFTKALHTVAPQFGISDPADLDYVAYIVQSLSFYEPENRTTLLQEQLPEVFPSLEINQAAQFAGAVEKQWQNLSR